MSNNQTNQSPPSRQEKISFSTFGPAMENPFLDQPEFKNIVYLKTKSSQSPKKSTSEEHSENIRKHVKELFQKLPRVVKMFAGSNTLCPRVEESARYLSPSQTKLIIIYNDEYKGPLIVPYYWPDQPIIHDSFTKFVDAEPPSAYEPKRRRSIDEGINDNKLKNRLPAAEIRDDEDDTKVGFKDDVNVDDIRASPEKVSRVVKMFPHSCKHCPRIVADARSLPESQTKMVTICTDEFKGLLVVPDFWPDGPILDSSIKFIHACPLSEYDQKLVNIRRLDDVMNKTRGDESINDDTHDETREDHDFDSAAFTTTSEGKSCWIIFHLSSSFHLFFC
jgi:hypothetical protein